MFSKALTAGLFSNFPKLTQNIMSKSHRAAHRRPSELGSSHDPAKTEAHPEQEQRAQNKATGPTDRNQLHSQTLSGAFSLIPPPIRQQSSPPELEPGRRKLSQPPQRHQQAEERITDPNTALLRVGVISSHVQRLHC